MKIPSHALPIPAAAFRQGLDVYLAARDAHSKTIGIEAPFPPHEVYRVLYERLQRGEDVQVLDTGTPSKPINLEATDSPPVLFTIAAK